jgi:hypothetical protein
LLLWPKRRRERWSDLWRKKLGRIGEYPDSLVLLQRAGNHGYCPYLADERRFMDCVGTDNEGNRAIHVASQAGVGDKMSKDSGSGKLARSSPTLEAGTTLGAVNTADLRTRLPECMNDGGAV